MAYDPTTGEWKPDETSVAKRITGLLSGPDNQYMQQAATIGKQQANRRGLLNSTMGVQAVESARIAAALPIASQDAAQAHAGVQLGRQLQSADVIQGRDIASQERMQGLDIGSRERMQGTDIAAQRELLNTEIGSRETMQQRDLAATTADRQWLAQFDAQTQERMQTLDANVRQSMQQLDISSQQRIAAMNVSASERNSASSLAASFEQSYAQMIATIMNNPDIPSADRQRYMDHAGRVRDSNLALVEQMYGIDLQWEASDGTSIPAGTSATPGGEVQSTSITAYNNSFNGRVPQNIIDAYNRKRQRIPASIIEQYQRAA